jgi:hypothetical protein
MNESQHAALILHQAGLPTKQIARVLHSSQTTVRRWTDPDYKQRELIANRTRKIGYRGTCLDCGNTTSYSGHSTRASERCLPCRIQYEHDNQQWTREAVLNAIHRFADQHGRPPRASEWIRRDTHNNYPARTSVYKAGPRNTSSPFKKWADAIEAAGYPRPRVGHYERTPAVR